MPHLPSHLLVFYNAFWRLKNANGGGVISMTEINSYTNMFEINNVGEFVDIIQQMDSVHHTFKMEQMEKTNG